MSIVHDREIVQDREDAIRAAFEDVAREVIQAYKDGRTHPFFITSIIELPLSTAVGRVSITMGDQ